MSIRQRLVPWLAMVSLAGLAAAAEAGQADTGRAALAAAVATRNVSLRRALFETVVYAAKGRPISAQYELEDGRLELSVYTERDGKFTEVVIDDRYGTVTSAKPITGGEELAAAVAETAAMAKAKTALADAVGRAETANKGFRAVSILAALREGRPVAEVSLLKGQEWRTAVEGLD